MLDYGGGGRGLLDCRRGKAREVLCMDVGCLICVEKVDREGVSERAKLLVSSLARVDFVCCERVCIRQSSIFPSLAGSETVGPS